MSTEGIQPRRNGAMSIGARVIRFDELHAQRWASGRGWTTTISQDPPDVGPRDVAWRVSVARVSGPSVFSDFTGFDRWFASLDTEGIDLEIDGLSSHLRPFEVMRFSGSASVSAKPGSASARDLNLMVRASVGVGAMEARRFASDETCVLDPPVGVRQIILVLQGRLVLDDSAGAFSRDDLGPLDGLELIGGDGVLRLSAPLGASVMLMTVNLGATDLSGR